MAAVEETPARTKIKCTEIYQIGIIVRDIRSSMRYYWETLGIGPWELYELSAPRVTEMTFRGKPVDYKILMAFANLKNVQLELIQPLAGDDTSYKEWLDKHGEGIQHLAMQVDDVDATQAQAEAQGIKILQSGRDRNPASPGGFTYLDTQEKLGAVIECLQRRSAPSPTRVLIETYP